jgi:hypothetical protein
MTRGRSINPLRMTEKQRDIMKAVCGGNKNDNGEITTWCDVDQIIDRLSYLVTKPAFYCSLRFLTKKGMIIRGDREVRRGRKRAVIVPTNLGFSHMQSSIPLKYMETEDGFETY